MKTFRIPSLRQRVIGAQRSVWRWPTWLMAGFMAMLVQHVTFAQETPEVEGTEVQTRGPVHEAFAEIVTFDAQAGVVVNKAPPEPIEELPPDEKPEGENVTWIPGYWAWDDERTDFLWVSGTWRA